MSIYEDKESYSQSRCVFLGGPIEHWWDTPENPDMFNSFLARAYRLHRELLNRAFVEAGYLVYRPHEAFKGPWNEKMQDVNDYILERCDAFVNMTPPSLGIVALGTDHEVRQAGRLGVPVFNAPFLYHIASVDRPWWRQNSYQMAKNFVSEVDKRLSEVLESS